MLLPQRPIPDQPFDRASLLTMLHASLKVSENRYARLFALGWLGAYPGDLEVRQLYARAMVQESLLQQALPVLEDLTAADPEFLEAQELLASTLFLLGSDQSKAAEGRAHALGGRRSSTSGLPHWTEPLHKARKLVTLDVGTGLESRVPVPDSTGEDLSAIMEDHTAGALAAVTNLRLAAKDATMEPEVLRSLAETAYERWPACLQCKLIYADLLLQDGKEQKALELLHQAMSQDTHGQVSRRIWGEQHPYLPLWPDTLVIEPGSPSAPQSIPVPAEVAAQFGWNQLPMPGTPLPTSLAGAYRSQPAMAHGAQGNTATGRRFFKHYSPPESLRRWLPQADSIARHMKKPSLTNLDGRYPVYVILTARSALERQYSPKGFALIDLELRTLQDALARTGRWDALLFYVDDPELAPARPNFQLRPAIPTDPWEVKLALSDLDAALGAQGEMIGAVLIVGGPQVIPFHQLPNPVDDDDTLVASDNPYATRDENYFIPEWPVGRLPGDASANPAALLKPIREIAQFHRRHPQSQAWLTSLWRRLTQTVRQVLSRTPIPAHSVGYSAAIWRRASLSVYRTIGEPRALLVSPPVKIQSACPLTEAGKARPLCQVFPPAKLGYFNLHGLPDAVEWFGQRDPTEPEGGDDFPLALRPEDIGAAAANGRPQPVPWVVFSEACYGAHILDKTQDQSISLKFITSGARAFVGSTGISYGSISTPLIAADLLGRAFWSYLREGFPSGEALRRAKIYLAREMHSRQGYLDGEDQKTLISFVLFGDPMAEGIENPRKRKTPLRQVNLPAMPKIVCDRALPAAASHAIPPEVLQQVKNAVSAYLPGMQDASLSLTEEHTACDGHTCPTAQFGSKALPKAPPRRQVVVLSKKIENSKHTHAQYARLTLNPEGKVVKLVVSR